MYSPMQQVGRPGVFSARAGPFEDNMMGGTESMLEAGGLARSDSMEITNDPRFFSDNVLNYRLAAFSGLSVVSGLMVQNAMDHLFTMRKQMTASPADLDGFCQFCGFIMLGLVLFLNMISVYVGVAQPYYTIRLMTAGPSGFEAAATYYLNKNIIAWRHAAVRGALASLPMFVASSAFRMVVKFDRENMKDTTPQGDQPPFESRIMGFAMMGYFLMMTLCLIYIHCRHQAIFEDRYQFIKPSLTQHSQALGVMSTGAADKPFFY